MAEPLSTSAPSSSPISRNYPLRTNRDKFSDRVIFLAVRGQSCPICLETLADRRAAVITACKHAYCLACIWRWSDSKRICPLCNGRFDSWFRVIDLASRKFLKEQLPALPEGRTVTSHLPPNPVGRRRLFQVLREGSSNSGPRSRPLPQRRSFGQPRSVTDHFIYERKLQWRASIYNRRLQAIPVSTRRSLEQTVPWNDHTKAGIVQRIEPWIRRELEAVLGDSDPSIIVHVASSLFIKILERKHDQHSGLTRILDDELSSLRKFLHDKTEMFLHELRCFAESSVTMETYDAIVEYKASD